MSMRHVTEIESSNIAIYECNTFCAQIKDEKVKELLKIVHITFQIAYAIIIKILETSWINLIEDHIFPPANIFNFSS